MKNIAPILLILLCIKFLPKAHAVSPPPDGGYAGGNTAEGQNALLSLSSGAYNTAVGLFSLEFLTTGQFCTGIGAGTLLLNTANENTATGAGALLSNTTGGPNTANGAFALFSNTTGNNNNAFGFEALFNNTTGPFNNAFGNGALASNITGDRNTAVGEGALLANTIGSQNIAIGVSALRNNSTGHDNIAIGQDACSQSSGGQFNTAVGSDALMFNSADGNTAMGAGALETNTAGVGNTADGLNALFNNTGNDNTAVGFGAGASATTGSNNVYIGAGIVGVAGESNACYIASIFGQTVDPTDDLAVFIDGHGKLGTTVSSRRFKDEIKPMDKASEAIMAFKPVSFHYKGDPKGTPQYGLIAEEVAKVNPNLVARDRNGEIMSVHYDQVWNMLLNEFLKEHQKVEQLKTDFELTIVRQQKEIQGLTAKLKEQATQIQKISAQTEHGKSARLFAVTNP